MKGVALSSDFIAGFCGETESQHQESLSLLRTVKYDMAYLFAYSMREVCLVQQYTLVYSVDLSGLFFERTSMKSRTNVDTP